MPLELTPRFSSLGGDMGAFSACAQEEEAHRFMQVRGLEGGAYVLCRFSTSCVTDSSLLSSAVIRSAMAGSCASLTRKAGCGSCTSKTRLQAAPHGCKRTPYKSQAVILRPLTCRAAFDLRAAHAVSLGRRMQLAELCNLQICRQTGAPEGGRWTYVTTIVIKANLAITRQKPVRRETREAKARASSALAEARAV